MGRAVAWVLAIGCAAVGGYLLRDMQGDAAPARSGRAAVSPSGEADRDGAVDAPTSVRRAQAANTPPSAASPSDVGSLLEQALGEPAPPHRVTDVARRADELRREYLRRAEKAEKEAAFQVANEIRKERALLHDQEHGGTMEMLRSLEKTPVHLLDLVGSTEAMAQRFMRVHPERPEAGERVEPRRELLDGTVLQYPPGVFGFDPRRFRRTEFPHDLVLEGAGIGATLLRLEDRVDSRSDVFNLTFRNLTLDCGNEPLTDLHRDTAITLRVDRCRVIGFGSVMLQGERIAFYATKCDFDAAFGLRPGFGELFRVRGPLLARLEDCVIRGPFRNVYEYRRAATYVFARCRFERMDPMLRGRLERPKEGVRLDECTIDYLADGEPPPKPRSFVELNPDWAPRR